MLQKSLEELAQTEGGKLYLLLSGICKEKIGEKTGVFLEVDRQKRVGVGQVKAVSDFQFPFEYAYLRRQPEWTKNSRLHRVGNRWMDAKVHSMQKDREAAIRDCQYVIENGNRLCYVDAAKQMLSSIES